MPRPNPPRKRPRKRPASTQKAVLADAQLTKQTAQSTQPRAVQPSAKRGANDGAAAAAVPPPDEMWSKRSYAILMVVYGAVVLIFNLVEWAFATGANRGPLPAYLLAWYGSPIPLVAAAIVAPMIARRLTAERRPLRVVESLTIGLIAFFLSSVATVFISFLLGATGAVNKSTPSGPTPLPNVSSSAAPSATASPTPSPSASASSSSSASPSPSAGASPAPAIQLTGTVYSALGASDLITLVLTYYIYPPLYKRLRVRRPPPPPRKPAEKRTGGDSKSGSEKK